MSLRVNTNIEAFDAHRNLVATQYAMSQSMERLSSGLRINSAADDAAGLAISEQMRAQINGLDQANRNALDGVSLVQTAEGAMNEQHAILQRMRELAVQEQNGTLSSEDVSAIDTEFGQLTAELSRIEDSTQFNGLNLLDASINGGSFTFQVGANSGEQIGVTIPKVDFTQINAAQITSIDQAITDVSDARSTLGAVQNRLEDAINNIGVFEENLTSAESRIRDVDVASEMVNLTRLQILSQSGTAMLSQANQNAQGVLSLLK
jgi:flagellin